VLAESGWHIYNQMEHLLSERTASMKGPPFHDSGNSHAADHYWPGMLPQTDKLVRRTMSIGIGVSDPNLGSNFGVTVRDGEDAVRECADRFRKVALRHLGG
jgi:8-amino-3,8-dideoxy-alpha-D-manno-octulosonate transaminase